jgi:GT2 family glycosyltransferase
VEPRGGRDAAGSGADRGGDAPGRGAAEDDVRRGGAAKPPVARPPDASPGEAPRAIEAEPPTAADLAVVIVTWNAADVIARCLETLLESAPADLEVTVADNASADETPAIVRAIAARDARVRLLSTGRNAGYGAASNLGAAASARPFVLFLNPDVALPARTLARMLARARADGRTGAVGSWLRDEHDVGWFAAGALPSVPREALDKLRHLFRRRLAGLAPPADGTPERPAEWVTGACLLARRAAVEPAPFFDERFFLYFEDKDLCKRMLDRGYAVVVAARTAATHVGGTSARKAGERSLIAYRESQVRYYAKHRGAAETLLLRVALTALFLGRLALGALGLGAYAPRTSVKILRAIWRPAGAPPLVRDPGPPP